MKQTFVFLLVLFTLNTAYAQIDSVNAETVGVANQTDNIENDSTDTWEYRFRPGVTYSSSSFKNWISGGNQLVDMKFNSVGTLNYKNERLIWENTLLMDYGFTKKRGQKVKVDVDKLDLSSRLSLIDDKKSFKYTFLFGIKSQFTDGYNYLSNTQWLLQSSFFAPGYITANFGFDYMEIENLNIHLSPISEKTTIVREAFYRKKVVNEYWGGYEPAFYPSEPGHSHEEPELTDFELEPYELRLDTTYESYGLEWRENVRFEVGANVQFLYENDELYKFLGVKSRLDLFISYANILRPDFDWETWVTLKINDYFAFNINFQLAYDYDIKFQENYIEPDGTPGVRNVAKLQLRNYMGFGAAYTFK